MTVKDHCCIFMAPASTVKNIKMVFLLEENRPDESSIQGDR